MTNTQLDFCKDIKRLCEAAQTPELMKPIIRLWAIYEDAQMQSTGTDNTKSIEVDWNKVPAEELDQLKVDIEKSAEAKKAVSDAEANQTTVNSELANKLNAYAADENTNPDAIQNGQV